MRITSTDTDQESQGHGSSPCNRYVSPSPSPYSLLHHTDPLPPSGLVTGDREVEEGTLVYGTVYGVYNYNPIQSSTGRRTHLMISVCSSSTLVLTSQQLTASSPSRQVRCSKRCDASSDCVPVVLVVSVVPVVLVVPVRSASNSDCHSALKRNHFNVFHV